MAIIKSFAEKLTKTPPWVCTIFLRHHPLPAGSAIHSCGGSADQLRNFGSNGYIDVNEADIDKSSALVEFSSTRSLYMFTNICVTVIL